MRCIDMLKTIRQRGGERLGERLGGKRLSGGGGIFRPRYDGLLINSERLQRAVLGTSLELTETRALLVYSLACTSSSL